MVGESDVEINSADQGKRMNGIENQENPDSGFYYSLSTNFQADSLFDNALSTELFFGETPPSSLSPGDSQRISPQSTGASNLDDGLRTPEPQSFPSDEYSDNCEMLNHHLVSDVNPSLQVASHVTSDLPNIDSDLIESQCNGTDIGKSYSPRQKDMDITFYSNLECIPEIPGISPLKTLDNNTDNPIKPLEELFDDDKDVSNISNESNIDNLETDLQSSCEVVNHHTVSNEVVSRLPDHKINISNSSENCLIHADRITEVNCVSSVDMIEESNENVSNPSKIQCSYSEDSKIIAQQDTGADCEYSLNNNEAKTLDELKNDSGNANSNSNPVETCLELKDNVSLDSSSAVDDQKVIDMQEAAESVDAISAAELAICQMLDAITDPPNQSVTSISSDTNTTLETLKYHILPPVENKCHQSGEAFCENNDLSLCVSKSSKYIYEEEMLPCNSDTNISVVPTDSGTANVKEEKVECSPSAKEYRTLHSTSIVGIVTDKLSTVNLECYVYLERLDSDFIKKFNTSVQTSRSNSLKKQKVNHYLSKCPVRDATNVSSQTLSRRQSRYRVSKKQKVKLSTKTPATFSNRSFPRRRYRCNICKRLYSSVESLEIHKCRKGKRAKLIVTASMPSTTHFLSSSLYSNFVVGVESSQCKEEIECQIINSDQRNSTYKIDQSFMQIPEVNNKPVTEQYDKEEPPFCCQKCSQVFRDKSLLVQHLCYMHSTQFTKCDVCKLKFDRNTHIRNHMLLHANHKAYCCQFCSFASSFQAGLERHMWAHHTPHDIRVIEGENVTDSNILAKLKPCSVVLEALPISGRLVQ